MSDQGLAMWVRIVLYEQCSLLDFNITMQLTLVSRGIAKALKYHIEQNYWFTLSETKRSMTIPHPGLPKFCKMLREKQFEKMVLGTLANIETKKPYLIIHYNDYQHPTIRRITNYTPTKQKGVNSFEELSPAIKQIVFSDGFDKPIDIGSIDNNRSNAITHIHFGEKFNSSISTLPLSLIELSFHEQGCFNQPITAFPPNITKLTFSKSFNHKITTFPPKLTHVAFGESFSQFIEMLPLCVVKVCFNNGDYNQPLHHLSEKIEFQKYKRAPSQYGISETFSVYNHEKKEFQIVRKTLLPNK
eukprot:TRINITY_DN8065_c0_g4_i1.p1 TRINITY_DN8065_c0_g4~~TRINITY_DN8065_c0_g4_i1.p1  ORF type:complete len:301 (-),score=49.76 TRINITY_DN8065_c0_g4_i1:37-939(-)